MRVSHKDPAIVEARRRGLIPDLPPPPAKRTKYGAKRTLGPNGRVYHSAKEARHAVLLHALQRDGLIRDLREQVKYGLTVAGIPVTTYVADFVYWDVEKNVEVVCDVKGYRTTEYRIKRNLMRAVYGITILEV